MTTEMIASIDDVTTGSWLVRTQTSSYLLDLDARTATRIPGDEDVVGDVWETVRLRSDAVPLPLISLIRCNVGESMRMVIDVVGDGVTATLRDTTPVISIEAADQSVGTD